jgi:hypothetical protein
MDVVDWFLQQQHGLGVTKLQSEVYETELVSGT